MTTKHTKKVLYINDRPHPNCTGVLGVGVHIWDDNYGNLRVMCGDCNANLETNYVKMPDDLWDNVDEYMAVWNKHCVFNDNGEVLAVPNLSVPLSEFKQCTKEAG